MKTVLFTLLFVLMLSLIGVGAYADPLVPSTSSPTVDEVVPPSSQGDTAKLDTADARADIPGPVAIAQADGRTDAAENIGDDDGRVYISLNYYGYIPTDSETRDNFGDIWHSFSIARFRPERPNRWVFDWDATFWWRNDTSDLLIIPVSVGVQRGFSQDPNRQSYLALRVGGYWGKVDDNQQGPDDSKFGADANIALGMVIDQKYVVEARYDWYSKLAGNDLNGFTLMAGMKIFSFKL